MKVRYRLVYCRRKVLCGNGKALIQVEATQRGKKKYFSSNIYVLPSQWNRRKEQIVNHPNSDALNAYLLEMVVNLERVELELWKRGITPTLSMIKERVSGSDRGELLFEDFCELSIKDSKRQTSTKKSLMGTLKCLHNFREGCSWEDLTYSFVKDFELYLIKEGYAVGTVVKHLRNLRTLINEAVASGQFPHKENPFKTFKMFNQRSVHRFLLPEELRRLEKLEVKGKLAHVRDAYLFCCYTGLRFSDFCSMRAEHFVCEDGCLWLRMEQKKTGIRVVIPLTLLFEGKGERLLDAYDSVEAFSDIPCNSKVNASLKVLQKMAEINTRMTFHTSRHTCATLLCHQGVPITTVQRILGHSSVSTTQIYQEVMAETIVKDLKSVK